MNIEEREISVLPVLEELLPKVNFMSLAEIFA